MHNDNAINLKFQLSLSLMHTAQLSKQGEEVELNKGPSEIC